MAHTYGGGGRLPTSGTTTTANPVTASLTLPAGTTALWVSIVAGGTTARSGGTPTFNGTALTAGNVKTNGGGTPETCAEDWYLLAPPTGAAYTLSIPNAGALGLAIAYAYASADVGKSSVYDNAVITQGSSTSPSTSFTVTDGAIWFGAVGTGAQTWAPSARSGSQINDWDAGSWGRGAQYGIKSGTGSQTVSWTFGTSEDWVIQAVAFKEQANPVTVSPSTGAVQIVGIAPILSISVDSNAWFARLTGGANTWSGTEGASVAAPIAGVLRFVGNQASLYGSAGVIDGGGTINYVAERDFAAFYHVLGGVSRDFAAIYSVLKELNPTVGTVRTAGQQPSLRQTWSASPLVGSVRLIGQQPTLAAILEPASGSVRFAGQVPTAITSNDTHAYPTVGVVRFVGEVPDLDVSSNRESSPSAGLVRLVGQQPALSPVTLNPQTGAIRVVGQVPYVDPIVEPAAGRLRFVGLGIISQDFTATFVVTSETTYRDYTALYTVVAPLQVSFTAAYNVLSQVCGIRHRGRQKHMRTNSSQRSLRVTAGQRSIRVTSCANQ